MNSALQTTLIMIVLALASLGAAIAYYPWPEYAEVDAEIGKPLFEEYSASSVRGIDIMGFNSDKGALDRMTLMRRGEKWLIPAKQNFIASESRRVGIVINSLNERTVYDVISENQEDHIEYGVVDPTEYGNQNPDSLGKKLTLTDRNNQKIAELIVGLPLKNNPEQRYVRIPGKPRVYTVEFDSRVLATDFALWNSANALRLQNQANGTGRQIQQIEIDNYKIAAAENSKPKKSLLYRASLGPVNNRLGIISLQAPLNGKITPIGATPEIEAKLGASLQPLVIFFTDDVRRKSKAVSQAFIQPDKDTPKASLSEMANFGFYATEFKNGRWKVDSDNGKVQVTTSEGVMTTISVGKIATPNSADSTKLNYFVMLHSELSAELLNKPVRPASIKDDESDENKAYLRVVASWEKAVETGLQMVNELNIIHGDWYYLVSEDIISAIRPELAIPASSAKAALTTPATAKPAESTASANREVSEKPSAESKDESAKPSTLEDRDDK